jgi:hypothetical protein
MDRELVLTTHPIVHGEAQCNGRFFTGLYSRRTDDGARRSTPLQQFDARLAHDDQRLVTHIANTEHAFDGLLKTNRAVVDAGLVNFDVRRSRDLWFKRFAAAARKYRQNSEYNHYRANNDRRNQPCRSLGGRFWMSRFSRFAQGILL